MDLSRTVTEINDNFRQKSEISPLYFAAPLKGFPLELVSAGVQKTRMMGLPEQKV